MQWRCAVSNEAAEILALCPEDFSKLCANMQDAWHYASRITNDAGSVFNGEREYAGLMGKCKAYLQLTSICRNWQREETPEIVLGLDLVINYIENIEQEDQLLENARILQHCIAQLCLRVGINQVTGESCPAAPRGGVDFYGRPLTIKLSHLNS